MDATFEKSEVKRVEGRKVEDYCPSRLPHAGVIWRWPQEPIQWIWENQAL